jgi:hypothetical protein
MRAKLFRNVPFARAGWQNYRSSELDHPGDAIIHVFRPVDQVRKSAPSFESVPLTLDHPDELLTAADAGSRSVGIVTSVAYDNKTDQLRGDLLVWGQEAIQDIARGRRELSAGYDAAYVQRAEGFEQRNIRGNHVALVIAGRSGEAQRIGG